MNIKGGQTVLNAQYLAFKSLAGIVIVSELS